MALTAVNTHLATSLSSRFDHPCCPSCSCPMISELQEFFECTRIYLYPFTLFHIAHCSWICQAMKSLLNRTNLWGKGQGFAVWPRLASDSWLSCLSHPCARIMDVYIIPGCKFSFPGTVFWLGILSSYHKVLALGDFSFPWYPQG